MASRRIYDLNSALQGICESFLEKCHAVDIEVLITCTYRSNQEQDALYAKGRTEPGSIVTNCQGGESKHNFVDGIGNAASKAFDIVPLRDGKPVWDSSDPIWQQLGTIGESLGLEWAGRWLHFKEFPHFQLRE